MTAILRLFTGRAIVPVALLILFSGSVPTEAAGPPVPITGTFFKGPAVGGIDTFVGPNVLQVRGEQGFGTLTGGVLTGSAVYLFHEEIVNFAGQVGTFHLDIIITKDNGSVITLRGDGFTSGASPTATLVNISGNWRVISAAGPDAGLQGHGQFTGVEIFQGPLLGQTEGAFSGVIH